MITAFRKWLSRRQYVKENKLWWKSHITLLYELSAICQHVSSTKENENILDEVEMQTISKLSTVFLTQAAIAEKAYSESIHCKKF